MIKQQDLFNIRFYEKSPFFGSYRGMHYRISRTTEDEETKLEAVTWPGPYNYETTDDSLKARALFEFSAAGLAEVCRYLNETYETESRLRDSSPAAGRASDIFHSAAVRSCPEGFFIQ